LGFEVKKKIEHGKLKFHEIELDFSLSVFFQLGDCTGERNKYMSIFLSRWFFDFWREESDSLLNTFLHRRDNVG
jgi:hypothetical protein